MKPAPLRYSRPGSTAEALATLASLGADGKVLAGGQSLVPLLSMRLAAPSTLVDINALPDLDTSGWTRRTSGSPRWRGMPTCSPRPTCAACSRCCRWRSLTSPTRPSATAGTVVGSLVHADAAAELPAVLCVLDGPGAPRRR